MSVEAGLGPPLRRAGLAVAALAIASAMIASPPVVADAGQSSITITVSGLPSQAKLTKPVRIKIIGPTGTRKIRTWKVTKNRTVQGLAPGLYAISAPYALRTSAETLVPDKTNRWLRIGKRDSRKVRVTYSPAAAGVVIPPPSENEAEINMDLACKNLYRDDLAVARYWTYGDPYSWYCWLAGARTGGLDLDQYCLNWKTTPTVPWWAIHKKMIWYCVTGME